MKDKYPYLKDPRALAEIRRHKWLESQKAGTEIGFSTAAIDWVEKYGEAWKNIHVKDDTNREVFLERRRYRRFKLKGRVAFMTPDASVNADPQDVSFSGILCRTQGHVSLGSVLKARISLSLRGREQNMECTGRVERITSVDEKNIDLFFSFEDACQAQWEKALLS